MADTKVDEFEIDEAKLEAMIAETDTGARNPEGVVGKFMFWTAFAWAIFQLWIASPFPYMFPDIIPVLNNTGTRSIHLAFAIFLGFLAYPALKSSPRDRIPIQDWIMAIVGIIVILYLWVYQRELADRPGLPTTTDIIVSAIGIVLVLEGARRALGPPLMIIAMIFLAYIFFGHLAPDVISWKGASLSRAMSHLWLTQEGVFGVALGVSTGMIFLFVLFGSLLEKAGAGNYFIWVAFSLLGRFKGGPGIAAVVSSALTGLISGSSISNVVTTGTFTIPLMKRVGFSAEKAGAVEVASSTNGQLTPPVMGAAAFLMIEYVGISYLEVVKHAILPALISYIALVYIVYLESCKAGLEGMKARRAFNLLRALMTFGTVVVSMLILSMAMHFGFGWLKGVAGDATPWIAAVIFVVTYLFLLKVAVKYPDLGRSDELTELPEVGPVVKSGLYFLLPVLVLIWFLMVERLSPALSAFWATVAMVFVLLTHKFIKGVMRGENAAGKYLHEGWDDFKQGMVAGSRNMIGIGIATAAAGLIIGAVTLTGVGLKLAEVVEFISGGNLMMMLILTAGISLLLGMGLPTTANYIVVSTLMAPVIVTLGAQSGLIVPLIAVHLFVFYFGILADDTPPVGLAAYAAAAISGADPIKTGIQGFLYDIRTGILPFMFIFNTEILLIGIRGPVHLILVIASTTVAMLLFAAATQGWFLTKNKIWETLLLLLTTFILFRPGYFMDMISPELETMEASKIYQVVEALPENAQIRVQVKGETLEGKAIDKVVMLPVGAPGKGIDRLKDGSGLELKEEDGKLIVDNLTFGGAAEKQKIDFDWEIASVQVKNKTRPAKQWFYLLGIVLLALVWFSQKARIRKYGPLVIKQT
ncbi:TRAP transporter permease [uncultured Cocleimonas sp.]|uniref:TRAP transporter permease n=1 Tax=uncultured Cocleimonas sp. TaxID=1051587 RepID=UPI0026214947|nr:TRAP transporter permease [uncultured Cocleimonas sp.]